MQTQEQAREVQAEKNRARIDRRDQRVTVTREVDAYGYGQRLQRVFNGSEAAFEIFKASGHLILPSDSITRWNRKSFAKPGGPVPYLRNAFGPRPIAGTVEVPVHPAIAAGDNVEVWDGVRREGATIGVVPWGVDKSGRFSASGANYSNAPRAEATLAVAGALVLENVKQSVKDAPEDRPTQPGEPPWMTPGYKAHMAAYDPHPNPLRPRYEGERIVVDDDCGAEEAPLFMGGGEIPAVLHECVQERPHSGDGYLSALPTNDPLPPSLAAECFKDQDYSTLPSFNPTTGGEGPVCSPASDPNSARFISVAEPATLYKADGSVEDTKPLPGEDMTAKPKRKPLARKTEGSSGQSTAKKASSKKKVS